MSKGIGVVLPRVADGFVAYLYAPTGPPDQPPLPNVAALVDYSFKFERSFKGGAEVTREETQTRIVDAAFRTMVEEGYHDTTIKDIAGRAGLATGLAHSYF